MAELGEALGVERFAIWGRVIELKVAGVHDEAAICPDGEGGGVGDGVGDTQRLHPKMAGRKFGAGFGFNKPRMLKHFVLFQSLLDEAERVTRRPYRNIKAL